MLLIRDIIAAASDPWSRWDSILSALADYRGCAIDWTSAGNSCYKLHHFRRCSVIVLHHPHGLQTVVFEGSRDEAIAEFSRLAP